VPNGKGTSLRYESPKGVSEGEKPIPVVPVLGSPTLLKVTSEEERQRLLQEQKIVVLSKYAAPAAGRI